MHFFGRPYVHHGIIFDYSDLQESWTQRTRMTLKPKAEIKSQKQKFALEETAKNIISLQTIVCNMISKRKLPSMRIELISEDIYSFAEVISEYETSVLTVKLRGRTLIG